MTKRIGIYNGSLDQLDKIVVSPMSRAFLFSDSIYEVIPFHKSEFIGFQAHIERLERSAAMLDINIDINLCAQEIILLKESCLLYTSPSPRDWMVSRMPSSA